MRIFSFSVKPADTDRLKLVEKLKVYAARNGLNFSHVVIEALKLYIREHKL